MNNLHNHAVTFDKESYSEAFAAALDKASFAQILWHLSTWSVFSDSIATVCLDFYSRRGEVGAAYLKPDGSQFYYLQAIEQPDGSWQTRS